MSAPNLNLNLNLNPVFGSDLARLPVWLQYAVPAGLLLVTKLLAGYLHEVVVYGLFERKYSTLQTLLHYGWLTLCALLQRRLIPPRKRSDSKRQFLSLGTASPREALFYYALLVFLKTSSVELANLSMTLINFPAKSLCKSASPLVVMAIGTCVFGRSYSVRDLSVCILLVSGLYLFLAVDFSVSPQGTGQGLMYIAASLIGSSVISLIHEHVIQTYHAAVDEVLYFSFLGSIGLSALYFLVSGEVVDSLLFISTKSSLPLWGTFLLYNSLSFSGMQFGGFITARFGALTLAVTNTSRKALSIALSFACFPERNHLQSQHMYGAVVFFSGALLRTVLKESPEGKRRQRKNSENELYVV